MLDQAAQNQQPTHNVQVRLALERTRAAPAVSSPRRGAQDVPRKFLIFRWLQIANSQRMAFGKAQLPRAL